MYSGYMSRNGSASTARLGKNSEKSLALREPPNQLVAVIRFTPGTEAMRCSYEIGRLKTNETFWRVTSREALALRKFQVTAATKVCSVQNRKMQTAMANTVLLVRIQLRRRCFRMKGANFITRSALPSPDVSG